MALIEVLQKRKLRNVLRPVNQHQMLENATTALNAITADGIKLVNIGKFSFNSRVNNLFLFDREVYIVNTEGTNIGNRQVVVELAERSLIWFNAKTHSNTFTVELSLFRFLKRR